MDTGLKADTVNESDIDAAGDGREESQPWGERRLGLVREDSAGRDTSS